MIQILHIAGRFYVYSARPFSDGLMFRVFDAVEDADAFRRQVQG
jgi:hypothetical protein